MFFLFINIKIIIVSKKILAILITKIYNFVLLTTSNSLKSNKNNLNIKSCNCNNKEEVSLKRFCNYNNKKEVSLKKKFGFFLYFIFYKF